MSKSKKPIFKVNEFKAIPTSMFEATHMQYINADGEIVETPIDSDFKMIYSYLYDQNRSFASQKGVDGEEQELYQNWNNIFSKIGRRYDGDKNSKKIVKILEESGLLIQTKRPNSTNTVKTVLDVTAINTIKFSNAKYDECKSSQAEIRQSRKEEYAKAKKAKLAAIEEVKKRHQKNESGEKNASGDEAEISVAKVECVTSSERSGSAETQVVSVKQETEVKPESRTNWELHSHALITQNDKYNRLSKGDTMRVMLAVNQSLAVGFKAIKEVFDMTVDQLLAQAPSQSIKQVGRICSGCYSVEFGTGWMCTNRYCENHDAEHEAKRLDDFDDVPF